MASIDETAVFLHKQWNGKIETTSKAPVKNREDLSIAYTPGVAAPCRIIAEDSEQAYNYTLKANTVAVVSDGSAVLGLGNIGPLAAMPVMEGKCVLFKEFGGVNAFPIVLDTQDPDEIVAAVKAIAPTFGGINLEDPIYLYTGPEIGNRNEQVESIKASLTKKFGEVENYLLYASDSKIEDIIARLQTDSLFVPATCVVLREARWLHGDGIPVLHRAEGCPQGP